MAKGPLANRFQYDGELSRDAKIKFLQSLDVFCTPTVYRESKGLPALEALANGVPVVLPAHGTFPELIDAVGGGLLVGATQYCRPRRQAASIAGGSGGRHRTGAARAIGRGQTAHRFCYRNTNARTVSNAPRAKKARLNSLAVHGPCYTE